ncbi:Tify domain binding domain - like 1 [Theobroma cacao]|nr:Tify domain binding domain - like 1 [Theobroma cacao]
MSFQHKSFWLPRDGGCLTNGEMGYDNSSRTEPKRGHQWFMDAAAPELFSNKKQAIESVNSRPVSGIADVNVSPWHNASSFQSVSSQLSDRLFGSEPLRTVNLVDRNMSSVDSGNMNMGRKDFDDQYVNSSSAGLSMSHTIEDPSSCFSFGGIRKVKVNQVRDSSNGMPASMGHTYSRGVNSTVSMSTVYSKSDNNAISLGPTYGSGDENTISIGPTFTKADGNFISMGHTFNKRDGDFISVGHNYNKGNESILSVGQAFEKEDGSFISMGQSYEKGDANLMSLSSSYGKGQENFISMAPAYGKPNESLISMAPTFDKEEDTIIPMGSSYHKADCNITAMAPTQGKGESSILSMGQNYKKGESNTISFGGFHDESETNPSGSIISGYDLLMNNQNSAQASEVLSQKELVEVNPNSNVNNAPKHNSRTDTNPKHKEPKTAKKVPPNNFPSNVKSLLSTGMLDGVAVKYVSWSREKSLKGYIQGTGYMCGCKDCKFEKALNAYEFERHANCKTKHPNNHIYFENGKTIYAVVQELKNTPQELLFDVIQNVTGSQINQKNFRIWKASYQAATRELQRIYGKDDVVVSS